MLSRLGKFVIRKIDDLCFEVWLARVTGVFAGRLYHKMSDVDSDETIWKVMTVLLLNLEWIDG